MARKNVPASTVRTWASENLSEFDKKLHPSIVGTKGKAGPRGRLHPQVIEAFHKANKSLRYETASEAQKPTVTVDKVPYVNRAGRNASRSVTVTTEHARKLLGHPAKRKGRFNEGELRAALAAEIAGEAPQAVAV